MAQTTTTDNLQDPYELPFNWATTLTPECAEERLFNLLPCEWQCEQGWMPLLDGAMVACPSCDS
jgi:hypothetical protein